MTLTCLHKFLQDDTAYLRRYVLRYAEDKALVRDVFLFLFGKLTTSQFPLLNAYLSARKDIEAGKGLPLKVLQGLRGTFHPQVAQHRLRRLAAKEKIKRDITSNDDSLIGKIRSYYKSGIDLNIVNQAIDQEAARLPKWNANIYFIVDTSASMQGFGHREYNNLAIAIGLLKDERFIILPQPLRAKALALRGEENYSKLWGDITNFNKQVGLKERGHLDELKRAYQPELLQTVYHWYRNSP
ncbi:hypothetical protein [Candidatus Marithrix sp. Canyon 246]|uniref:hypothetical protein n=1 Tax=Candidatus Marithrix sp. Canyon 246 TaxID=1827136 RepID=UPI00114CDA97|nr:hypothetical protein [Candidatus Marithrix sp. Canyon 246]